MQEFSFEEVPIPTTKFLDVFPAGDYRGIFHVNLSANISSYNVTADVINTSPDKNVFG